jgi:hypothetical protein
MLGFPCQCKLDSAVNNMGVKEAMQICTQMADMMGVIPPQNDHARDVFSLQFGFSLWEEVTQFQTLFGENNQTNYRFTN